MIKTLSLLLILTANAWAADPFMQYDPKCALPADSQGERDPFDPSVSFARGPNQGKCGDTREERSVRPLSAKEQDLYQISVPQGSVSVANFFYHRKPYIAVIDPNGIADAIYQIESFPAVVPAAHNQIRFKMKPGSEVLLYSQTVDAQGRPMKMGLVTRLREFAFTSEAVSPTGEDYDVFLGMQDHYGLAYRFVAMADKFESMIKVQHHDVRQLSLNITREQRGELLKNALGLAAEYGQSSEYHTLFASCTTEAFRAIDRTIPPSVLQEIEIHTPTGWLGQTYPIIADKGLRIRGLIKPDGASELPKLDQDQELIGELTQGY